KLRPRTAYDAKFSLPYCLAHRFVKGTLDVTSFSERAIFDPDILEFANRTTFELKRYAPTPDAFSGGVRVRLRDGRTLETEIRYQRGSTQNPMTSEEVIEKYEQNSFLALPKETVRSLRWSV